MNYADKLSELTGVSRPDMDQIYKEVKANSKLLEGCVRPHDFSICLDRHTKQPIENPNPAQHFGAKWKCSKCGGIVDSLRKISYVDGLKDGKL